MLERDFRGGIAMLSQMGYREVELYGPFPFSDPEAIARWKNNELLPVTRVSGLAETAVWLDQEAAG